MLQIVLSFFCLHQLLTKDVIRGTTEASRRRDRLGLAAEKEASREGSSDAKIHGRVMPGERGARDYRHSARMDKSIFSIKVILLIG